MGSGCNNCNNNEWQVAKAPDTLVEYTGDAIPELGICTGDMLSEIESVILTKILSIIQGEGITLSTLNVKQCAYINQIIASNIDSNDLQNVLDIIIKAICALASDIAATNVTISHVNDHVYDLKCLTIADPSVQNIIQALIDENCTQRDAINTLFTDVNNPVIGTNLTDQINDLINQRVLAILTSSGASGGYTYGIDKTLNGTSTTAKFTAFVPPYSPIPSFASRTLFDNSGKGLVGTSFEGWYICNGNNGTPDMRGYVFGGATDPQGPGLDARVDPIIIGSSYATTNYDKRGEGGVKLQLWEMPAHTHYVSPVDHDHFFNFYNFSFKPGSGGNAMCKYQPPGGGLDSMYTSKASTGGYNTDSTGGSDKHENRQPTIYGLWIMRKN